jgi:hypothetical protein
MTKKTFRKTREDIKDRGFKEDRNVSHKRKPKIRYVENRIDAALKTADATTLMELEDYIE